MIGNTNFTSLAETYLKSNAMGRQDGALKANTHEQMSILFVSEYFGIPLDKAKNLRLQTEEESILVQDIVRKASRPLTDALDEKIGFPLDSAPNYRRLVPKFITEFKSLCLDSIQDDVRLMTDNELKELLDDISRNKFSMMYHALASYGFNFVDGDAEAKPATLTKRSVLGQEVTVTANEFFGCKYKITGLSSNFEKS